MQKDTTESDPVLRFRARPEVESHNHRHQLVVGQGHECTYRFADIRIVSLFSHRVKPCHNGVLRAHLPPEGPPNTAHRLPTKGRRQMQRRQTLKLAVHLRRGGEDRGQTVDDGHGETAGKRHAHLASDEVPFKHGRTRQARGAYHEQLPEIGTETWAGIVANT